MRQIIAPQYLSNGFNQLTLLRPRTRVTSINSKNKISPTTNKSSIADDSDNNPRLSRVPCKKNTKNHG